MIRNTVRQTIKRGTTSLAVVEAVYLGMATVRLAGSGSRMTNLPTMSDDINVGDDVVVDYSAGTSPAVRRASSTSGPLIDNNQPPNPPDLQPSNIPEPTTPELPTTDIPASGYFVCWRDWNTPEVWIEDGQWLELPFMTNTQPLGVPEGSVPENASLWQAGVYQGNFRSYPGSAGVTGRSGRYLLVMHWNRRSFFHSPSIPYSGYNEVKVTGSQEGFSSDLVAQHRRRIYSGYQRSGISSIWMTGPMVQPFLTYHIRTTNQSINGRWRLFDYYLDNRSINRSLSLVRLMGT